ncbi:unnamed protein product [Ectocarpus fasciculatus]
MRSGNQCTYNKRRWRLTQAHQEQHQPRSRDRNGVNGRDLMRQSSPPGASATSGRLPFKRFRFSASPATGLVGMQENAFLSDFFGCVGFFPLTTQSHVRESMVKMMSALQRSGGDGDQQGRFDEMVQGANWSKASEGHQLPMNPSTCTFWCAIALGALVKGRPIESVTKYSQLAHEALAKSNSDPADAEVAKAWAILAYLHGWIGDLATYQQYLALSESYLRSYIEHGSTDTLPVGFSEVVTYAEISDSCCEQRQMGSFIAEEEAVSQLNGAATEGEIYQHVAQSFKAFEQASHAKANAQMSKIRESQSEAERDGPSESVLQSDDALLCTALANAMGTLLANGRCIDFEPLEATVDRPGFGGGVGSLFINVALAFVKGVKGDPQAAMERLSRCVEVYERYPGLCCGTMGHHKAHFVLVCLAAIKDSRARAMYERLRRSYNSFRPADALPVPPFEEWHGVGTFCDYFYCRAIEGLVASEHMKDFSGSQEDIIIDIGDRTNGTDGDKDEATLLGDVNIQRERRSTCYAPQSIIDTDSDGPSEGGADGGTGSSVASTPPASPVFFHYPSRLSEARVHSDRFKNSGRSVVIAPDSSSRWFKMGDGGEMVDDAEDECIGTGNWLDVTHAMLEAL